MPGTAPGRFTSGVSTDLPTEPLAMFGLPDPTAFHTFFDDFDNYEADQWVATAVGTTPTAAIANAVNGILLLTMAATDDSSLSLQYSGDDASGTVETWRFAAGKRTFFKTRFAVSDITQSDFVLGLQITDTTPLAVTDGVYFRKDDGDTDLDFVVIKDSAATTTTFSGLLANATFIELGFHYDGKSSVEIFANGRKIGTSATTNLVDDEELTISVHMQNGEAVSKTMSLDYLFVSQER